MSRALNPRQAIALAQLLQSRDPRVASGQLRPQIALALVRSTNIVKQQRQDIALDRSTAHDLHRRNAKTFLIDLPARSHRSGVSSSNVGVVRTRCHEEIWRGSFSFLMASSLRLCANKDRRDQRDVRQMRTAAKRIVQYGDVA